VNDELSVIMSERRQLINLGYRLLGSLADAETWCRRPMPGGTRCRRGNGTGSSRRVPG